MSSNSQSGNKLTLMAFILMIFTSVFGFVNIGRGYYLMSYSAIPWYILSALTFFIPYAFMMAEYGAAFKNEKGGIYSWMEKSVGAKYAFIGTFMWYASYVIWMVNTASNIWIPFSTMIYGKDMTMNAHFLGMSATQVIGLLGILWMIIVTVVATKGLEQITKVTSVGGTAVALLNIVLLVGAIVVLIANGGELAEPIKSSSAFLESPNPGYQTPFSVLSFLVFAIFAFGGIEVVGGLVDKTENPEVTFPKGIAISAAIISVGYAIGILMCGIFTNWNDVLSSPSVHLGNVAYVLMNNLGYQLGISLGATQATSITIGLWVSRFVGLSMFLAYTGAFFTLAYSPLKQLIEGTPKELWPGAFSEIKNGMPANAMKVQCIIVSIILVIVSFGGEGAGALFSKLILMTNVAMTIPYMFLAGAFYKFKQKKEIKKPFEVYKSYNMAVAFSIIVTFVVGFANVFTIIAPAMDGDWSSTIWMIAGPLVFSIAAIIIYNNYEKKLKKN